MADYSINAIPRRVVYTGSAGVGPYAFTFEVLAQTDIAVYKNSTKLTLTTDYSVTVNANGTGAVTLVTAAATTDRIIITGARAIKRTTDFATAGDLVAASLNEQFDANVIFSQQVAETTKRALTAPVYDPEHVDSGGTLDMTLPAASSRASRLLGFNAQGNPTTYPTTVSSTLAGTISYVASGFGAVGTTVETKLRETVSVKDFGAVGNNVADDTAAFSAAIAAANGKTLYIPAGTYKITSSLSISGQHAAIVGDGVGAAVLKASGNFAQVLNFAATAAEIKLRHFTIETSGTTTRCATLVNGSQVICFADVQFTGNAALSLVYSQASGYCTWDQCRFDCDGASTLGLELDMYNQNTRIFGATRFGGIGLGMAITKSGAGDRVEGVCIDNTQFIVTGGYSLSIGNSLLTQVVGCNLDQAGTYGITISSSADDVLIKGNWIGLAAASTGVCINFSSANGGGHVIEGNSIYGGATGIGVSASASLRVSSLAIANNKFGNNSSVALSLDSVGHCRITGNIDAGTPTNGSWITSGTHASKGSYYFDNNTWHTTSPSLYDTASTYRFGSDRGIVMRNNGVATTGNGATSVTVSHGLSKTPTKVLAVPKYTTGVGAWFTNSYTSTEFTITWVTATVDANCVWAWEAEV